jgi:hypothetical protein
LPAAVVPEAAPVAAASRPGPRRWSGPSYHYLELTIHYHAGVIEAVERRLHSCALLGCNEAAEKNMKIYLLMLLMSALFTAIHFTSTPERQSETLPR